MRLIQVGHCADYDVTASCRTVVAPERRIRDLLPSIKHLRTSNEGAQLGHLYGTCNFISPEEGSYVEQESIGSSCLGCSHRSGRQFRSRRQEELK